jgi:hypothetical protein
MTFSITVPNASQSPGLFPAQNNTNFQRLKDIINNDHNFTDTTAANQGVHRQVTLIDRSAPVGLPSGTNGILYSEDVSGASQLRYYNGSQTYFLTPGLSYWASVNSNGAILSQSGGLTVTFISVGNYLITFTTPQTTNSYGVNVSSLSSSTSDNPHIANYTSIGLNSFVVMIRNQNNTPVSRRFTVSVYGN